ncbi:hypothetical protein CHH28_15570 [Bacterioplanes sanyensis]|uniref:N-acetyltransferase domain-containing protein n=1 Tax=Bacterioplanes sanyensis TaxID=1249553 RepID=A0A222FLV6_9GAMM|nr:GNAT family N-acetyltransferase [Bacterioplanes sanyensis]ASP40005.1 hypothetical protein CHH28_15570 [Bacterioplanes sanyensis]
MEIVVTRWQQHKEPLQHIRRRVFIEEQGISEQDEWDDDDLTATHFIAYDGKRPLACARLLPNGYFGRLAVLAEYRRQSWGSRLLRAVEKHAAEQAGMRLLKASAQVIAYDFYRSHGYQADADFHWDGGIAHLSISKVLGRNEDVSPRFVINQDSEAYTATDDAGHAALLQLLALAAQREILLQISDLEQPVWRQAETLQALSQFVRHSRQRRLRLLLPTEYPGIADHPLIQLQQRLNSRFECRLFSAVKEDEMLVLPAGVMRPTSLGHSAHFSDRATVAKAKEQFEEQWKSSQPLREGKRLGL